MISWGLSLQHQGRIEEAVIAFTAAAQAHPGPKVHEFLLYALFFAEDGVRRHAAEVRRWAELHAPPVPAGPPFANPPADGRRLRVGYVAPGFMNTQVRQFVMPVLEGHDRSAFDIFLFPNDAGPDAGIAGVTVRGLGALSDQDAAEQIRRDGVDVLVDLWGHTAGGRLGVFALKPAPVQCAWVNYVQSTGLAAMDYVLHAEALDAPGTAELFTEEIWPIGPVTAPFRPSARAEPTPTPALSRGYVAFASFNHPARLNDQTVAAWARILNGRAGSRLILKYDYYVDAVLQNATCARFAAHGVDPSRIEFRGRTSGADYLREFGDIDLALDPSPAPGGTTSSEAVANGVPVLTLRGPDFYSRIGVLRLEPLGLHELIAEDWDDYVARALALTADVQALQAIRQRVVDSYEGSAIRDEAGFTRRLEAAFAAMFARWEATGR
jgi:predicted O-linked N-acetylglucosamine transferase (SPINDLY family)